MKITKSQLKQIIKEELSALGNERRGPFWTPENAHEGVNEMEGHIHNLVGALQELAQRLDKINPKLAASEVLKKHKV
tara:strand:- start:1098 stop:1328 length:231 start_codon:yes stop_codon:yes gene_type:complete